MDKKKVAKTSIIAVSAVALAGLAFATPSMAQTAKHNNSISSFATGKGDHGNGQHGKGPKGGFGAKVNQDVTVTVPDDGATYKLVVTETATAAASNTTTNNSQGFGPRDHSVVVPVTGTGSVTVSVPGLHPGSYKVELVKVSSSQDLTVAASTAAGTTATK